MMPLTSTVKFHQFFIYFFIKGLKISKFVRLNKNNLKFIHLNHFKKVLLHFPRLACVSSILEYLLCQLEGSPFFAFLRYYTLYEIIIFLSVPSTLRGMLLRKKLVKYSSRGSHFIFRKCCNITQKQNGSLYSFLQEQKVHIHFSLFLFSTLFLSDTVII